MANEQSAEQQRTDAPRTEGETSPEQESAPGAETEAQGPADEAGQESAEAQGAAGADAETESETETAESASDEVARLQEELDAARRQAEDYWNRLMRSEAEKENIRKRAEKDVESARKQSLEKLAGELLGVRDSLEMGVDAAQQSDADVEKVREGTEMTLRMLQQAMEKFDIEEINPEGQRFNPELHQAMSAQELEGYEANTVISVMQKGYRIGDRLLRPALVMVAK